MESDFRQRCLIRFRWQSRFLPIGLLTGRMESMSTEVENMFTWQQLFAMPDDGNRYELIEGVLRMMSPAGSEHGKVAARILARLVVHVEPMDIGEVFAAETGFRIASNPDTVRAPDAAFVSHERLNAVEPTRAYLALAPDLVVEVVSPNDSFSEVESKSQQWLDAGCELVLVADPENETLQVYRQSEQRVVLKSGEIFDSGDVCENWKLAVNDVFKILE